MTYCTWCGNALRDALADCQRCVDAGFTKPKNPLNHPDPTVRQQALADVMAEAKPQDFVRCETQDEAMAESPPNWRHDDRVSWMLEGQPVWYQSSPHHRHAGVIIGRPRVLGDGWVVPVGELEPPVPPGKTVSSAAWHEAVTPRLDADCRERLLRSVLRSLCDHIATCSRVRGEAENWQIYHAAVMLSGGRHSYSSWKALLALDWAADQAGVVLEERS